MPKRDNVIEALREFRTTAFVLFSPEAVGSDEEILEAISDTLAKPEDKLEFIKKFRNCLLGKPDCFAEKARECLMWSSSEEESYDYLRHCWELLAPDQPWPCPPLPPPLERSTDEWSIMKFGPFTAGGLRDLLSSLLNPKGEVTDERILQLYEFGLKGERCKEEFAESFRALLLDESMSWTEKADRYLGRKLEDGEALRYFRHCWELLHPDQPWPLAEPAVKA